MISVLHFLIHTKAYNVKIKISLDFNKNFALLHFQPLRSFKLMILRSWAQA